MLSFVLRLALLAGSAPLLVPPKANAQADAGRVVATVTDTTGAAIPNATLTLTNTANGSVRSVNSNGSGQVNVEAVPVGNYSARMEAAGFTSQSVQFAIIVTQAQTLTFKLVPGEATSTVEVTTAAALVNTTDPTLGETIESKQITQLPLNGRNALNLALLTPGVTQGTYTEFGQDTVGRFGDTGGGVLAVNGIRPQANNFILDGIDNNDGLQNVNVFFPNVDGTEEFKVITSVAGAQYGRAGGALVISSTRAGTNHLHGSAFEQYRSGKWAANPNYRFLGAPAVPNPSYNRSQFGGSAGLPVLKDKVFLFGDYEGTRVLTPFGGHYDTVPTVLMRQGNFSELLDPALNAGGFITSFPRCVPNYNTLNNNITANSRGQIYDPQTAVNGGACTPFTGNIIPAGRLNPAAVNYFNAFPLPSRSDRVLNNYFTHNSSNAKYNRFNTRVDWSASASDQFFLRFSYDNSTSNQSSELDQNGTNPQLSANGQRNFIHARGYALGYTHVFTPHAINQARIGYVRDNYGFAPSNNGVSVGQQLGIANSALGSAAGTGGPLIGGSGTELTYTGDFGLFAVPQNNYEISDTLNLIRGSHNLSVGGTVLRRQVSYYRPILGKGGFFVNSSNFTGYDLTEYLVGGVDNYQIGSQTGFFSNINQEDGVFAQDDWRVNRRLTLNLGVRYDLLTWPYEAHNQQATLDVTNGHVLQAGVNGVPKTIVNQDYLNFAPRVGFAYDVAGDGKTALHGGYGIFYFPDYGGISNQLGQNPPFGGVTFYFANNGNCITFTGQTAQGAPYTCPGYTSGMAASAPLPTPGFKNFDPANPPQGLGETVVDRNNKHSRLQQYNVQLQQQFGARDVFSVAYVGTRGDRLSTYYNNATQYNAYTIGGTTRPFPNLGYLPYNVYNGSSNYNGMQLHYEHRATNLLATASYSWAHALDNTDSPFGGTPVTILLYYNQAANYGNSSQDERHIASTSFVYNLPFGRGQRFGGSANRAVDLAIGGWQINNIVLLSTGQPVDLNAQGSAAPNNRPDLVGPIRYPKSISGQWFDPSSFANNIPFQIATDGTGTGVYTRVGTLRRNQVYGPGNRVMNLGIQKNVRLSEGKTIELHGDAFNVTNTANFSNPNNFNGGPSTNFGRITGLRGSPRQIQVTGRFVF